MPSKRNASTPQSSHSTSASTTSTPSGKTVSVTSSSTVQKPSSSTPSSSSKPKPASTSSQGASDIVGSIWSRYVEETPQRTKLIDAFLGFLIALGGIQFVYVILVGNYPFNAFLSGFSATVGQFVLAVSLRMQTNPENKKGNFEGISDERAFADFVFGSLILHLFCINFIN